MMGKVILIIGAVIGLGYAHWKLKHNRYHGVDKVKKKELLFDAYTDKENKKDMFI
jgi:hypothetical protein